jgi:hypothetical protein
MSTHAARAPLARISLGLAKVRGVRAQLALLKKQAGADAEDLSGEAEQ